jgi:enoyl-CoA hydratase/carnithine racemase
MDYECIQLDTGDDGVAVLTLDRPEQLNAWNDRMGDELSHALARCDADPAVRVVVVTGAGRAFCAGADLSEGRDRFATVRDQDPPEACHPWDVRKPVVAAVNGHAIGVGITFAMSCDLRFVAEDAKIAFAFPRRGVLPGFASHATVARVAGLSNAADLLLSGRTILGSEAARLGIATKALPAAEVLPAALAWGRDAAREAAPIPQAVTKRLLWEQVEPNALKVREDRLFALLGRQPDAKEGVQAFLDKRAPRWRGDPARDLPETD